MILLEFSKAIVPKPYCDIFGVQKVFVLKYLMELNNKPFKHGKAFLRKEDVLDFCKENNISIDDLRKVWRVRK